MGNDPGSGDFSFMMEQTGDNRFINLKRDHIYWESEECGTLKAKFDELEDISFEVYNLSTNFSLLNSTKHYDNTRLFLDSKGVIQLVENLFGSELLVRWKQPNTKCLRYNECGYFASCNGNDNDDVCKCLPGFYNDYSGEGNSSPQDLACCKRRQLASCTGNGMAFLNLTKIKTGRSDIKVTVSKNKREINPPVWMKNYYSY